MGSYRTSCPAYASSAVLPSPAAYAEEAVRYKRDGWAAYKIHPPTRWGEDIAVCEAVRDVVGDDYKLMLDATWCYQYPAALQVGFAVEERDFRSEEHTSELQSLMSNTNADVV